MAKIQPATSTFRRGVLAFTICMIGAGLYYVWNVGNATAGPDGYRLCGRSWVDADGSGLQKGGQHGGDLTLGGVEVTLTGPNGETQVAITSDTSGNYFFGELEAGIYELRFSDVEGFARTVSVASAWSGGPRISVVDQNTGKTGRISVPQDANAKQGSHCTVVNLDAGYRPESRAVMAVSSPEPAPVESKSIEELKAANLSDSVRVPTGYTTHIQVLDAAYSQMPAYTIALGDFTVPADVLVDETKQIVVDKPTTAGLFKLSYSVLENNNTLYSSEILLQVDDAGSDDYSVCGRAFFDENGNSKQDPSDSVLNGVSVVLYDDEDVVVRGPFETFKGGNYAFNGLKAGSYYVEFEVPVSHSGFVEKNRGNNQRWDSDVDSTGFTPLINLPADKNEGEKKSAVCTVNWIDAGFR